MLTQAQAPRSHHLDHCPVRLLLLLLQLRDPLADQQSLQPD
jgi:hypothetical protein